MGMGRGRGTGRGQGTAPAAPPPAQATKESELATLRETLKDLRQQLADTMDKIEALEKES
jgi:ribosomal protein L19E